MLAPVASACRSDCGFPCAQESPFGDPKEALRLVQIMASSSGAITISHLVSQPHPAPVFAATVEDFFSEANSFLRQVSKAASSR